MKKLVLFVAFVAMVSVRCTAVPQEAPGISIIPEPVSVEPGDGVYKLKSGMSVAVTDSVLLPTADYLIGSLRHTSALKLKSAGVVRAAGKKPNIVLSLGLPGSDNTEAYELTVDQSGVTIRGAGQRGVILGIATLQQLIPIDRRDSRIPYVSVRDEPRFGWRGMHMDVSRHFFTVDQVKEHLDLMARYKFNKFHWHLTDDQGWRIEIKQYPDLVTKGAWRHFDRNDRECMALAAKEDNPDCLIPRELLKVEQGDTLYGGYYTQEQIKEVVAYAAARGIDVIPEIDMPGHMQAAEIAYPWITCFGTTGWGADFSQPICPGKDSTLQFAKDVYSEVFSLFPYEYVHLGADEVEKENWKRCPDCQARMKAYGLKDERELQAWFVREMEAHFIANGKKLIGWDEIYEGGLSPSATVMWWRDWSRQIVPATTAAGQRVILSPDFLLYLDFTEMKVDLERIYNTEPTAYQPDWNLSPQQAEMIWGVQANTWAERIPTVRRQQYQMMPRMLAVSELGWIAREAKDWERFREKLVHEVDYLDRIGVNYRIPDLTGFDDINVFVDTAWVTVNSWLPNITVRYTLDGTFPTASSPVYTGPFPITESAVYTFRGFRPDGSAGMIQKAEYRKEGYAPALKDVPAARQRGGVQAMQYDYRGRRAAEIPTAGRYIRRHELDGIAIPANLSGWLGLVFERYIELPEDGIYSFSVLSDDGSNLYVDQGLLIDNDGQHGPTEKVAQRALAKGWHKITVEYFDSNNGGQLAVRVLTPSGALLF